MYTDSLPGDNEWCDFGERAVLKEKELKKFRHNYNVLIPKGLKLATIQDWIAENDIDCKIGLLYVSFLTDEDKFLFLMKFGTESQKFEVFEI